jgi:DNA-directed RNA polymerase subunit beta'
MKKEQTVDNLPIPVAKTREEVRDFSAIGIKLASPDRIKEWSYGEVTKPETINYRTQRSERNGLFDERIFGPEKDFECYCGKYRRIRYKNIICEKCGVEVTRSIVRRERMGHIELASPVTHIWFLRSIPGRIGTLLGLSISELEKVVYFAGHIIVKVKEDERARILRELDQEYKNKTKSLKTQDDKDAVKEQFTEVKREIEGIRVGKVLDEALYHRFSVKYGTAFEADIGAEALYEMCRRMDLGQMQEDLEKYILTVSSTERVKVQKRLNLVKAMRRAGVRPEWMFITVLPVIPPGLRPMVPLDGGRHATSDINDLYRRVINRNNRLKKLKELSAPEVILRNEKRILQEAVDALIDNSIRRGGTEGALSVAQRRPLKSLSDMLKGKSGRFRQNLLGKRVDYSGRSVIVVGPELKLYQCGLPKHMALELFRPFVISRLLAEELAFNIRGANRLIDDSIPEVWAILEEVIRDKYVLLNRAPTLHRLGIQAFKPILIEGNAIQVHPLVCSAFNADFDGDQMAVHVPLSEEAQLEARELMAANKNIMKPGNGEPVVSAKLLDIVLGCYWMTKIIPGEKGEGEAFPSPNSAITAHDFGRIDFRAKIKVLGSQKVRYAPFNGELFETSVGRILFNTVLPEDYPFVNQEVTMKDISRLVDDLIDRYGIAGIVPILDKMKSIGFRYATKSGTTWGIDDLPEVKEKPAIVAEAAGQVAQIEENHNRGLLSDLERSRMTIEVWQGVKNKIEELVPKSLDKNGSVYDLLTSKARGSISNLSQMAGMKGLIVNTASQIIDFPIIPSYREGLSPLEYFVTTHGARKGLADTALQTAKAGYLTRKMVDVAQDIIVLADDCGDKDGRYYSRENISGFDTGIGSSIEGKVVAKDIVSPSGEKLFARGHLLTRRDAKAVEAAGVTEAWIRSPLSCKTVRGICRECYGLDLGRNHKVKRGEAVGIVAAQAIGEPGTQLTMRTFHAGGIASAGGDITTGLPRVEEIFERRVPKVAALIAEVDGEVIEVRISGKDHIIAVLPHTPTGKKTGELAEYLVPQYRTPLVKKGDNVKKGDLLTDGLADLDELFKIAGKERAENYILNEVKKVYEMQGASISRKHIEVIIRKMFSRKRIKETGDTRFLVGEVVEAEELLFENEAVSQKGGTPAGVEMTLLGISEVALSTTSFLSAASFQNTTRVLIENVLSGKVDRLRGLKENVIIGRLIPAGTGLSPDFIKTEVKQEKR